jgi:hypothetical protein
VIVAGCEIIRTKTIFGGQFKQAFRLFCESISMKLCVDFRPAPVIVGNARRRFHPDRKELWLNAW